MLYFDIGAYVGDKSAEYVSLGAKVIAVEPNPDSYATLVQRFQGNPQVITINKAVSDFVGSADLSVPGANLITLCTLDPTDWFTGRFAGLQTEKTYRVEVTTLDNIIFDYGTPDFVKLDVEGSEEKILTHLGQRIPKLSFEYRADRLDSLERTLTALRRWGDYRCVFSKGDRWFSPVEKKYQDMLTDLRAATHNEPDIWGDCYVTYRRTI